MDSMNFGGMLIDKFPRQHDNTFTNKVLPSLLNILHVENETSTQYAQR